MEKISVMNFKSMEELEKWIDGREKECCTSAPKSQTEDFGKAWSKLKEDLRAHPDSRYTIAPFVSRDEKRFGEKAYKVTTPTGEYFHTRTMEEAKDLIAHLTQKIHA